MIRKVQWVYNSKVTAKKGIQTNQWEKLTELRKSDKAIQCIKLQIWDHSNKVLVSKDFNRSTVLSMSSNVWALCSFQVNHIRHARTIFQTFEDWISNQFHHAERRDTIVFGITHWVPNKEKTSLDKVWTNLQWSNKWSMVSSSHWHRQHQLTRGKFFLTRLSIVRIPPIVHIYVKVCRSTPSVHMSPNQYIELDWVVRSLSYGLTLFDLKVILCVWYCSSLTWTNVLCFLSFNCWHVYIKLIARSMGC